MSGETVVVRPTRDRLPIVQTTRDRLPVISASPGDDGADGDPGVHVGPDEPTNPDTYVWVDTDAPDALAVPDGGTTGQLLAKASDTDFDTEWIDAPSGGGGAKDFFSGFNDTGDTFPSNSLCIMFAGVDASATPNYMDGSFASTASGDGSSITLITDPALAVDTYFGQVELAANKGYAIGLFTYMNAPLTTVGPKLIIDVFSYPNYTFFTEVAGAIPADVSSLGLTKLIRLPDLPVGEERFMVAAYIFGPNLSGVRVRPYLDVIEL